jgi:glycosyltransferase involved in cell wall biosynthesis
LRILLSAYACDPNRGSELGNGWNWAYNLASHGNKVLLLTRAQGKKVIEKELLKQPSPNLKVKYIDVPGWCKLFLFGQIGVYLHYFLWQKQAYLISKHLAEKIDVVHHVTWGSLKGGSELWKLGKPFVFGPIGGGQITPNAFLIFFKKERITEWLRTIVTQNITFFFPGTLKTVSNSKMILVSNRETLAIVQAMNAKHVDLFLDTGLPIEFVPKARPIHILKEKIKILWVGRVYPLKGLELIFAALSHVTIPFEFNIIGDGPWGHKISGWIKDYGLTGKVYWHGSLIWGELKNFYLNNDIFFFTSLRDSFGSQLLEAMAHGLPVITLNQSGARDFVPDGAGFKVNVTTPEETAILLAKSVERLWYEPELRERMGVVAYRFAKKQTWDKKVFEMEKIYKAVIKNQEIT